MYALYAHDDSHEPTDRTHFVHLSFSTLHHLVTVSSPLTSSENGPIAPKEPINLGRPGGGSFGMLISIWRRGSSLRGGAPLAISIAVIPNDHMSLKKGYIEIQCELRRDTQRPHVPWKEGYIEIQCELRRDTQRPHVPWKEG